MNTLMNQTSYGKAALKKMGEVPENFFIYKAEWLEDHLKDFDTMKVTGAVLRKPIWGAKKDEFCIPIEGTERTVYVNKSDMKEFRE